MTPEEMIARVLYRDGLMLVIDKPAGFAVHKGPKGGESLEDFFGALRFGIHHGAFCAACCWGLMMIQLVLGVMNLTVMVGVAVVIALEKLLPRGEWLARTVGLAAIAAGVIIATLSVRAL